MGIDKSTNSGAQPKAHSSAWERRDRGPVAAPGGGAKPSAWGVAKAPPLKSTKHQKVPLSGVTLNADKRVELCADEDLVLLQNSEDEEIIENTKPSKRQAQKKSKNLQSQEDAD